jgi:hypothetical protein
VFVLEYHSGGLARPWAGSSFPRDFKISSYMIQNLFQWGKTMDKPQIFSIFSLTVTLLTFVPASAAAQDVDGSKDPPLFNRLPNYYIDD